MSRGAVKRGLTLLVLAVIVACGPRAVVGTLEGRPSGRNEETLAWTAVTGAASSTHAVRVGMELDPARLLGWTGKSVQYRTLIDVMVTGPDGFSASDTVMLPITDLRDVERAGQVVGQSFEVAGTAQSDGFYRVEPVPAKVRFRPAPGEWRVEARIRVLQGAPTKPLEGIRSVRVEILGPAGGGLTGWSPAP